MTYGERREILEKGEAAFRKGITDPHRDDWFMGRLRERKAQGRSPRSLYELWNAGNEGAAMKGQGKGVSP